MKIAFIHNDKKIGTGAHYINDLISLKLKKNGLELKNFYPKTSLIEGPIQLNGLKNILFFYSLLEKRREILKFDLIQGTTYTPLPFLAYKIPVVAHFGSTTRGFLKNTPQANTIDEETKDTWYTLKKNKIVSQLNIKTRRPLRDIAEIEEYVAQHANAVIATSLNVVKELEQAGVPKTNIHLIHNAIEDYWFETKKPTINKNPRIIFLGRLGNDAFTLKLKGLDRLIHIYNHFPHVPKHTFCMSTNKNLLTYFTNTIPNHTVTANTQKDKLPNQLAQLSGSILFIPSRYEGFSLSLIEGMSQGLIPLIYAVGVAPEIIINGKNGYIVTSQKDAIKKITLILKDEKLRKKLSRNAAETAHKFKSDEIAQKLTKLYESLID